jgi:hypothetical protein
VIFGAFPARLLSTQDMSTSTRIARRLVALLVFCLALMITPMSAHAATAAKPPAKVTVSATLLDTKVKVNGKARIKGRLDVESPLAARGASALELVVVQQLKAGLWVDLAPSRCYPNSTFRMSVSFSVAADYTLRVYHPATELYAAAYSSTFVLTVIG